MGRNVRLTLRHRLSEDSLWLYGYAAPYGQWGQIPGRTGRIDIYQRFQPGLFREVVATQRSHDIYLSIRHDRTFRAANTRDGSLRLEDDAYGLYYTARVDNAVWASRIREYIRFRKDRDVEDLGVSVSIYDYAESGGQRSTIRHIRGLEEISIGRGPVMPGTSVRIAHDHPLQDKLRRGVRPEEFPRPADSRRAAARSTLLRTPDYTTVGRVVRGARAGDGPIRFIAATEGRKSDGVNLQMDRADLDRFRANPVIMYGHHYSGRDNLPIGRAERVWVDGPRLMADILFDRGDPFAADVERKYREGYLNAVSVGFDLHGLDDVTGIPDRWELIEISAVPIPLDGEAIATSKVPRATGAAATRGPRPALLRARRRLVDTR